MFKLVSGYEGQLPPADQHTAKLLAHWQSLQCAVNPNRTPCEACGQFDQLFPWRWIAMHAWLHDLYLCRHCIEKALDWQDWAEFRSNPQIVYGSAPVTVTTGQSALFPMPETARCHCENATKSARPIHEIQAAGKATLSQCVHCYRAWLLPHVWREPVRLAHAIACAMRAGRPENTEVSRHG